MSSVRLLSPSIALVDEIVRLLNSNTADISNAIVVFPGKRPSHVLRKKLSGIIGRAFIPPKIFSIDIFIDHLCTDYLHITERTIDECDAVAVIFDQYKKLQNEGRISREYFTTLETFYPVGVKIFSELEELTIAGVTPPQLAQAVASVTTESAHMVSLLFQPVYNVLHELGYITRAQKYKVAAENISTIDVSTVSSIIFAGFYAFTQTEEMLIRHFLSLPNVTMLFQQGEGIGTTLEQLSLHPAPEGVNTEPEQWFYESPDAHGQFFALNRVLSETFSTPIVESDEAVIVLPSPENLFPLYHQTLSMYDQSSYNLALGYPVSRTPVYGFLLSLLDVVVTSRESEVYVPKYIQFLLHPYTKNILYKTRTDVTRIIVHAIEDDCLEHSARVFIPLDAVENNPALHADIYRRLNRDGIDIRESEIREHIIRIHDAALRPFLKIETVGGFAESCIAVLQFINEHSTAHRHPYFRPFVETLIGQFSSLHQSLLAGHSFSSADRYQIFIRHVIESAEVPFTGTPLQGLQVLGFLELRGLKFKNVFLLDMNDDVLPGKAQQDVLLPLTIREHLGLSTYRDQERMKTYIFDLLRRGAETVHYFYINNNEKEQSRFIAQQQWKEQRLKKTTARFNTKVQEYSVDLGTRTPQPITKLPEHLSVLKEMRFSSTALDTYLTCGLRFYYAYVLRLAEKGEISGDVEHTDVGKIVHAIFAEYFTPALGRTLERADLNIERLQNIINDTFRRFYGSTQFGEQFFTRRQVEKHLVDFVTQFQSPLLEKSSVVIEALEQKFSTEIDGFAFTGNADRIETRNGITYILDYKTGKTESYYAIAFNALDVAQRETWKDAIGSLQLVLYVMLYSSLQPIAPEKIVPAFIFLGKKELDETIEAPLFDSEEQMKEWYPKLKEIVLMLTGEIVDASKPFLPTNNIKNDCPECPFSVICGTQWTAKFSTY